MKSYKFFLTAFVALMLPAVCFADDRPIPVEQLPAAAKTFVKQYFPDAAIAYAQIDVEMAKTEYEARLNDGTKVEFDAQGNWTKVDCEYKSVPAALIPVGIANYVKGTYPTIAIIKISKKWYGYEVELMNDLDLRFDKEGKFVGIDD